MAQTTSIRAVPNFNLTSPGTTIGDVSFTGCMWVKILMHNESNENILSFMQGLFRLNTSNQLVYFNRTSDTVIMNQYTEWLHLVIQRNQPGGTARVGYRKLGDTTYTWTSVSPAGTFFANARLFTDGALTPGVLAMQACSHGYWTDYLSEANIYTQSQSDTLVITSNVYAWLKMENTATAEVDSSGASHSYTKSGTALDVTDSPYTNVAQVACVGSSSAPTYDGTINEPSGILSGDLLIMKASWFDGTGSADLTISGWTPLGTIQRTSQTYQKWFYRTRAGSSISFNPGSNPPTSGSGVLSSMYAYRCSAGFNPILTQSGNATSNPFSITLASMNVPVNNSFLLLGATTYVNTIDNPPAGNWFAGPTSSYEDWVGTKTANSGSTGTQTVERTLMSDNGCAAWFAISPYVAPPPYTGKNTFFGWSF